jgi:uncharacterized protein (DUF1499 family)
MFFAGKRPQHLGVKGGQLARCPSKPNCVSSQAEPQQRAYIAPLAFGGTPAAAMKALKALIEAQPGATIVSAKPDYLYAEFASSLLGFVDDVEFALDATKKQWHVRSASRLGYSDFGVNRKRIEKIRALLST